MLKLYLITVVARRVQSLILFGKPNPKGQGEAFEIRLPIKIRFNHSHVSFQSGSFFVDSNEGNAEHIHVSEHLGQCFGRTLIFRQAKRREFYMVSRRTAQANGQLLQQCNLQKSSR